MTTSIDQPGSMGPIGRPVERVDGRAKVTGQATYSAEWALPGMTYAVIVAAPSGPGRVVALDTRRAEAADGVLAVLSHLNARPQGTPHSQPTGFVAPMPDAVQVFSSPHVAYAGQPIAAVVAETLECAREGARLVEVRFDATTPAIDLEGRLSTAFPPDSILGEAPDGLRGDLADGVAAADISLDEIYTTAAQSHNPMEPHATTAVYKDGRLTLYDASQFVYGVKRMIADLVDLPPERVRVVCRYVGGAFGSKLHAWPHVTVAALAAMHVGRPVRLAVERRQMFGLVGFRPRTHQRIRLGAKRDGMLTAIAHDVTNQTSQASVYVESAAMATRMLYSCPNVAVTHRVVRLDTQTPTFQRGPGEAPGAMALECALDELAYRLGLDPLALRLKNYADRDEDKGRAWSSKELRACYEQAARRFGWDRRLPAPRSMRAGELLVGQGMATASYPALRAGASARVRFGADGALVQTASHDLGTGSYTIFSQVAAAALGLPIALVKVELGDTDLPFAPEAGGSQTAASVSVPLFVAATKVRKVLTALAVADAASPLYGAGEDAIAWGDGRLYLRDRPERGEAHGAILERSGKTHLEAEHTTKAGEDFEAFGHESYGMHAWGAQFAEVHVDPTLGTVRVTRMVGAFCGGTVLNARTARSQLLGGMAMGIGMALLEEVMRDVRQGRVVNASLGDYLVPVNADVPDIDVILVPEEDPYVNPLGIKGLGEVGIVGAGAAIANAVFHATGKRVREFPIMLEHLL
ncbi:MAG: aldehyde oxidase and xanthine dehydrogenase, molybdopterin binding [Cyanobacteria bacterium RYN_339]|nr:aldehyde oxidase and xanthine dehydrogenase, molybdopterin binding [Cyanobacteria bacterium RYN_339]